MPLSDRNTAQYTIIRILTVDQKNSRIEGILRDGGKMMAPVRQSGAAFRWPRTEEVWFVKREGIDWTLVGRLRGLGEPLSDIADNEVQLDGVRITRADGQELITLQELVPEPWHQVGNTGEPVFSSPWTHLIAGEELKFMKDPLGFVHFQGAITGANGSATQVFTLPVGYRPNGTRRYVSYIWLASEYTIASIIIASSGVVNVIDSTSSPIASGGTRIGFNQVQFRAEA
jgi:hypothetical protein